ncbi:AAA family ATPase [bacterium]|nr:AAA family ATPase [bacterium]
MLEDVRAFNNYVKEESAFIDQVLNSASDVIVGQRYMLERILMALIGGGHILLEGVPGLAKTLTVSTLSQLAELKFQRIQFTPDLLPADLIGTLIYNQHQGEFQVKKGPIFANLILADEINRAPAKVQSALLEAMQEKQVTIGENTYKLEQPFVVMATQNPVEQEGTYPLPEAQLDRFMFKIKVGYPKKEEEKEIMKRFAYKKTPEISSIITPEQLIKARNVVEEINLEERLANYIVDLIFVTREPQKYGLSEIKDYIDFGASPRATINLHLASRLHAFIKRRGHVMPEDIKAIAPDILRHRIILSYEAEADNVTTEEIITRIFDTIPVP